MDVERAALVGDRPADDGRHTLHQRDVGIGEGPWLGRVRADDPERRFAAARDADREARAHAGVHELWAHLEPLLAGHVVDDDGARRREGVGDMATRHRVDRRADHAAPADAGAQAQPPIGRAQLEDRDVVERERPRDQIDCSAHDADRVGPLERAPRKLGKVVVARHPGEPTSPR